MRNLDLPGRSVARSLNGMAATSHGLATLTALDVLRGGGNAMDAAVAACAVQGVVEPESTGIGGDCFVLYAPKGSAEIVAFNGSGRAPQVATPEWFARQGIAKIERFTPHAVTVPGAVDAWAQLLRDHGTRSLGELLLPAIRFAREGFAVTERVFRDWQSEVETLSHDPATSAIYLPNGGVPALGSVQRQPLLAASLELIARDGRDAFYKGSIAEDLVAHLRALGGLHALEDFAAAGGQYVDPIKTSYKGYDIYECPPNGQGIIALLLLNILAGFDLPSLGAMSAERLHLEIEATRLAYQERDAHLADPALAEVPAAELLSADYAARLRARIRTGRASVASAPAPVAAHADTVYISVVDKDRNAVSFINSLFSSFGSGITGPKSGVVLQNRGTAFSLDPEHPNCIAPGKRPMHTIIPGMAAKGERVVMPFGVMGGHYQAAGHARFLTNLVDFGLDVQQSMDLARIFPPPGETVVEAESGVPAEVLARLEDMGHSFQAPSKPIGGSQAIQIDWEAGTLAGGSDPRKDGCALGYWSTFRIRSFRPVSLDPALLEAYENITTATITTILLKKGLRNVWLRGTRPLRSGQGRLVGPAFTLRFVPAREDLATPASWSSPTSTRGAIEDMPEGVIAVVDAMGVSDAGIFGDILCARMQKRGVTALVTDGVLRDLDGVEASGLPVWCSGVAAPPSVAGLTFVGWQQPIACGGVAVFPDDLIVTDRDGAVVVPQDLIQEVAELGLEQERLEGWIMKEVQNGAKLPGLYPMNDENRARYEAEMKKGG